MPWRGSNLILKVREQSCCITLAPEFVAAKFEFEFKLVFKFGPLLVALVLEIFEQLFAGLSFV